MKRDSKREREGGGGGGAEQSKKEEGVNTVNVASSAICTHQLIRTGYLEKRLCCFFCSSARLRFRAHLGRNRAWQLFYKRVMFYGEGKHVGGNIDLHKDKAVSLYTFTSLTLTIQLHFLNSHYTHALPLTFTMHIYFFNSHYTLNHHYMHILP